MERPDHTLPNPTGRNACCRAGQPLAVDKPTQARYCLTPEFAHCPRLATSTAANG